MVILLDDTAAEGEPEAPAAFFCGVAGVEDGLEALAREAFPGVGDFDPGVAVGASGSYGDCPVGIHGVDCVFDEVLHYPLEE